MAFAYANNIIVHGGTFTDVRGDYYNIENILTHERIHAEAPVPDVLPAKPAIFFGRDDLVADVVEVLLESRHVTLIGPGGIGKTSVARAVLNDDAIADKFSGRRYFVRYDDLDPSRMTYPVFLDRIARAIGIPPSRSNTHALISKAISTSSIVLVLDSAETFLDAEQDAGRIKECIDDFGARPTVAIVLTTRLAGLPSNLAWERLRVPALEESAACAAFRAIYLRPIPQSTLSKLLYSLDFHPLSINLLAQAAVQNEWSPEELVAAWDRQHSLLLEHGNGKIESIEVTIEISLNSPSLKRVQGPLSFLMQLIAFLPQGVDKRRWVEMFPADTWVSQVPDILFKHSLVYFKDDFVTMLSPIRLYISSKYKNDSASQLMLPSLSLIYFIMQLEINPEGREIILNEDVNMEHVLMLNLKQSSGGHREGVLRMTNWFLRGLMGMKPRPTALSSLVLALHTADGPPSLWSTFNFIIGSRKEMGICLVTLGLLAFEVGQIAETKALFEHARSFYLACGIAGRTGLTLCDVALGNMYTALGNYPMAETMYESAVNRRTYVFFRSSLDSNTETRINLCRADIKAARGEPGLSQLRQACFESLKHLKDPVGLIMSCHTFGYAELWAGDYKAARKWFKAALASYDSDKESQTHLEKLIAMADVAYCEGNTSESAQFLKKVQDILRKPSCPDIHYAVEALSIIAAHAAVTGGGGGDFEEARGQIRALIEKVTKLGNVDSSVNCFYVAACIELRARDLPAAARLFLQTVDCCKVLSEVHFQARALGALGEIAVLENDMVTAKARFDEANTLCEFMGVKPECLYPNNAYYMFRDMFKGWTEYHQGRLSTQEAST